MSTLHGTFGIAARNFTAFPQMPDAQALVEYGVRMEELGFDSIWVWDHIFLGVDPHFPIIDSLTLLTAIAARTKKIKLSTGILVLPLRNPVILAKQISSMDQLSNGRMLMAMAAGWYKREFDAVGVPYEQRGKIMGDNLDILKRLWTEDMVNGEWGPHKIPAGVMFPKPVQKPCPLLIGGYADRVLKRAAVEGDGWLTYFYKPDAFVESWSKVCAYALEAGKDPATLMNGNQLPIMVGSSRAAVEETMMKWLNVDFDIAQGSQSTMDSAIMGNVDECVAQLKEHIDAGVQKLVFVPYKYEMGQIEIIAREIVPRLRAYAAQKR
ncbi:MULTISPECIES: LLM class flavin-dependent oxidoreductase [Delftia]|uniref:TIGR03619 family F420-dependent LLM class oxidoreductase n=1 Tax=Delftia acidovorans TaxID=80866 RepID=A0A7T2W1I8_DELAC|nr:MULTISPECIES: TIGR03619 family F420-dependent LLM class oxidoreductase [Delftia]MBB1649102.1 LLM class F420-dependent oxidoreductase [Delftia sp. UME58]QPS11351.1 TIGR03619 family F420-dependent LLM class oxidoreductase [Delftia acidovorans]